jgi:hypothetical protein
MAYIYMSFYKKIILLLKICIKSFIAINYSVQGLYDQIEYSP